MKYGIPILIFLLSFTPIKAQETTPFKILLEAKVGTVVGRTELSLLLSDIHKNQDLKASVEGGVFFAKNTIGGIGVRIDRIRQREYDNTSFNNVEKVNEVYATGISLHLLQRFRLQRKEKNRLSGFIKIGATHMHFYDQKIIDKINFNADKSVELKENLTNQVFIFGTFGSSYKINDGTAVIIQVGFEQETETNNFLISNFTQTVLVRKFSRIYLFEVGIQQELFVY